MDSQLVKGSIAPDFSFDTAWETGRDFYVRMGDRPALLVFLRYYGCPLCQMKIRELIENYPGFEAKGAGVYVVLQSAPETIRVAYGQAELPFDIICDPEQKLYALYSVGAVKSEKDIVITPGLLEKIQRTKKLGLEHGKYEGNELQLPATFVIGTDKRIAYALYGKDPGDVPATEDLLRLF